MNTQNTGRMRIWISSFLFDGLVGLTLIEVVVALGVLMVGLGATVTLIVSTLSYSQRNENAIVVVNLAREGIETIRAVRDETDQGFLAVPAGTWAVDGDTSALDPQDPTAHVNTEGAFSVANCEICHLSLVNGKYVKGAATQGITTPYARAVEITNTSDEEKKVVSTVVWTERGRTHAFQLEDRLYNWR